MTIDVRVVVIGGGPAGLAAAATAAEHGASVALIDQAPTPGGQIWRHRSSASPVRAARPWIARTERAGVRVLAGAEVIDAGGGGTYRVHARGIAVHVRGAATVLATGARELFLPFPGWTLPGAIGAGGLQALFKQGLEVRGRRIVLAGSGPLLLPVASTLSRAGARLVLVAEQAPAERVGAFARSLWRTPARLMAAGAMRAGFIGTRYAAGTWVVRADGDDQLREATLTDGARSWREPCDLLAVGYGLVPSTELARLLGAAITSDAIVVDDRQSTTVANVYAAGECTGVGGAPLALAEGAIAGLAAAGVAAVPAALLARRASEREFAARLASTFALRDEVLRLADDTTIVCRCEDVKVGELGDARDAREARLHSRVGMGACQGRVCGAALAATRGWTTGAVRPPVFPAPVRVVVEGTE